MTMTMNLKPLAAAAALAFVLLAPAASSAHFILQAPASWIVEDSKGDPQKSASCGGIPGNPGTPTGAVTAAVGGSMLHLKVQETIYHPGHYRVALAVLDRNELPADPEPTTTMTDRGVRSVSGKIDPKPKAPVLIDDLWDHHEKPEAGVAMVHEADIKLPNINCDHCTLQVIQFMEEHGLNAAGDFSYHHCADLKITANPKLKLDSAWPGQTKARKKS
jgi:hypothetical protein